MLNMICSPAGIALTKRFEGLRLVAYQDSVGVWTIGYGHTGADVHSGLTITQAQADALLIQDLATAERCVNGALTRPVSQSQFDSLVDFTYNVGTGNLLHSTMLKLINGGNLAGAAGQFGLWVHAGGRVLSGLVTRRAAEQAEFQEAA